MITLGKKLKTNFKLKVVAHGVESEVTFKDLLKRRTIVSVYMKITPVPAISKTTPWLRIPLSLRKLATI